MVQLNLNFTHVCRYTRVLAHLMHAKLQKLACAHSLLQVILACPHGIANTRDTREIHVMSSHLLCHTTHVV